MATAHQRKRLRARVHARRQITLPEDVTKELGVDIGDDIEFIRRDDGTLMVVPADQAWFWTPEWQAKEREADEDITAGRVTRFASAEEFIAHLEATVDEPAESD